MHALGSTAMAAMADGIRESRMSAPATGFAPMPSRCAAPPARKNFIFFRESVADFRKNLADFRESVTDFRKNLADSRKSVTDFRKIFIFLRKFFKILRKIFKFFPKNHPHLSNFWPFSPQKPVFFRFWRLLRHFPGISPLAGLSPSPPLKEERVGVRRPSRFQAQSPSPQPSPRLGGEREPQPPPR